MLSEYAISLGDHSLILGQRLAEWCGHGPALEVDIAMTNIALDLMGQTRSYYQYAAQVEGKGRTEDDIAFLRDGNAFKNVLLVEQPNGDFAQTIVRQFFFDAWHDLFLEQLKLSKDDQLSAIAEKSIKEVNYHLRFSSEWVIRLGDGTEESQRRMQEAVNTLWMFTGELCSPSALETDMAQQGFGVDLEIIRPYYQEKLRTVLTEATLQIPASTWDYKGGKDGRHTEHHGHILAEMQWMQRAYPGMDW